MENKSTNVETGTTAQTDANTMLADSLRAGDIVDINIAGEWKERYGIVNEVKEEETVWTMRFAGHDGCCWTYSWKFGVRKAKANFR